MRPHQDSHSRASHLPSQHGPTPKSHLTSNDVEAPSPRSQHSYPSGVPSNLQPAAATASVPEKVPTAAAAAAAAAATAITVTDTTTSHSSPRSSHRRPHPASPPNTFDTFVARRGSSSHASAAERSAPHPLPAAALSAQHQEALLAHTKRPRTTSPSGSDEEAYTPASTTPSDVGPDSASTPAVGSTTKATTATSWRARAARTAESMAAKKPPPQAAETNAVVAPAGSVDDLMVRSSLNLNDASAPSSSDDAAMAGDSGLGSPATLGSSVTPLSEDGDVLPAYSDAMQQSVSVYSPGEEPKSDKLHLAGAMLQEPQGGDSDAAEIQAVKDANFKPLVEGERWYLIDREWYRNWSTKTQALLGKDDASSGRPFGADVKVGGLTSRSLVVSESGPAVLRPGMQEDVHFKLLHADSYRLLSARYGVRPPIVSRSVIELPDSGELRVEFYPPTFVLYEIKEEDPREEEKLPAGDGAAETAATVRARTGPPSITLSVTTPLKTLKECAHQRLRTTGAALLRKNMRFWRLPEAWIEEAEEEEKLSERGRVVPAHLMGEVKGAELVDAGEEDLDEEKLLQSLATFQLDQPTERLGVEFRRPDGSWPLTADGRVAPRAAALSSSTTTTSNRGLFSQSGGDFFAQKQRAGVNANATTSTQLTTATAVAAAAGPATMPDGFASSSTGGGRVTRSQTANSRGSKPRGLTGLYNLGNTCFLAAAVQCMSNTPELKEYFITGTYRDEINTQNPLGMRGEMAEVFGELLHQLWSGTQPAVHPRHFKSVLSRHSPQFIGYAQQDSQELLAFLLDGLHEDLNRIKKKPYIEAPDWEGGGVKEMVTFAKRQWEQYKMRNDSVIVDLFQGQYKSTLVCPVCEKVSIKFDPFMYLTLPIPNRRKRLIKVYYVPHDPARRTLAVEMQVAADTTLGRVKRMLAEWFQVDPHQLFCAEVWSHGLYRILSDYDPVVDIGRDDYVYFWEAPFSVSANAATRTPTMSFSESPRQAETRLGAPPAGVTQATGALLPVFSLTSNRKSSAHVRRYDAFGVPFLVGVPADKVNDAKAVQRAVLEQYMRYVPEERRELLREFIDGLDVGEEEEEEEQEQDGDRHKQVKGGAGGDKQARAASASLGTRSDGAQIAGQKAGSTDAMEQDVDEVETTSQDDVSDLVPAVGGPHDDLGAQDPPVAEITDGGDTVRLVPDTSPSSRSGGDVAATAPLESKGSAVRRRRTKRGMVTLYFGHRSRDSPIPTKMDHIDDRVEELGTRAARLGTPTGVGADSQSSLGKVAATSPMPPSERDVGDGEKAGVHSASTSSPSSWPLVYTGSGLACVWEPAAFHALFGGGADGDRNTWGEHEDFLSPELRAERDEAAAAAKRGDEQTGAGKKRKPHTLTIDDCLDEFTKEEQLGEEDPWYCPSCKEFRQASKKFDLWKVPDILVVHLKRFSAGRMARDKISDEVDFPIEGLDLTSRVQGAKAVQLLEESGEEVPTALDAAESVGSLAGERGRAGGGVDGDGDGSGGVGGGGGGGGDLNDDAVASDKPVYDLYAVDNHYGGLGGGHYTAYAKNPDDGNWYYFDDSSVRRVHHPDEVKGPPAYLLFYRRRTQRRIGGKSRQRFEGMASASKNNSEDEGMSDGDGGAGGGASGGAAGKGEGGHGDGSDGADAGSRGEPSGPGGGAPGYSGDNTGTMASSFGDDFASLGVAAFRAEDTPSWAARNDPVSRSALGPHADADGRHRRRGYGRRGSSAASSPGPSSLAGASCGSSPDLDDLSTPELSPRASSAGVGEEPGDLDVDDVELESRHGADAAGAKDGAKLHSQPQQVAHAHAQTTTTPSGPTRDGPEGTASTTAVASQAASSVVHSVA